MTSSSAVPSTPSPKPLGSLTDDGGDESEYEEIEEEIEVEEEVEIEEEVDEEVEMELESVEEANADPVKSEAGNEIGEDLTPVRVTNQDNGENEVQSVMVEGNHTAVLAVGDQRPIAPRLHLPQMRARDPLSSDEFNRENKKLRRVCEFHAKGWCIRGSSCMFLHTNNGSNAAMKRIEVLEKDASSSAHIPPQRSWENFSREFLYSNPRQPSYFGTSSWNANASRTLNIRESELEHQGSVITSSQRSIPPVSEALSLNLKSRDTWSANYKPMFSSWEPSLPFCASHEITRSLILKKNLNDHPTHESTDEKAGKKIISHSDQGSSVKDMNVQSNIMKEEEKALNSAHVDDTKEDNILISSDDGKLKFDKTKDEVGVDSKQNSQTPVESNDYKIFQFALVDFVKELVKPTWREGLLSRDAHKLIVKKSVDRILISMPPEIVPKTNEHAKDYLLSCKAKIADVVKAYVKRHRTYRATEQPQP